MTEVSKLQAEPAGAARFQAASVAAQTANAAAQKTGDSEPVPQAPPPATPYTPQSSPNTPRTFVDDLKDDAEAAMNLLESRVTELEQVVHRVCSAADGEHAGISAWLSKVGARLKALL